jgi:hypothetical protein
MNPQQAKEILTLYRPGTADAEDAYFCESLRLCETDPELKRWLDEHCAAYVALRARFKQVRVPEGLKEQILAERKVHTQPLWRRPAVLFAAAAALIALVAVLSRPPAPHELSGYPAYLTRMVALVRRTYGMDLVTDDLGGIRAFFQQRRANPDYVVPATLQQKARVIGCGLLSWQGRPVNMICFTSGRPLTPGQASDLWLLVTEDRPMPDAPASALPTLTAVNGAATASWRTGGKIYLLVAEGNEQFLREYL